MRSSPPGRERSREREPGADERDRREERAPDGGDAAAVAQLRRRVLPCGKPVRRQLLSLNGEQSIQKEDYWHQVEESRLNSIM
jgi:hypothetical protein